MFGLGMSELLVVFFIILLLFGAKNIPDIARGLGKAMKEFRQAANDLKSGLDTDLAKEPLVESPRKLKAPEDTTAAAQPGPEITDQKENETA